MMPEFPSCSSTQLAKLFTEYLTSSLKELLENRHLYQSVSLTDDVLSAEFQHKKPNEMDQVVLKLVKAAIDVPWRVTDPHPIGGPQLPSTGSAPVVIQLTVPDVKLFCECSGRREAFNLVSAEDVLSGQHTRSPHVEKSGGPIQALILSFQCQACKGVPQVLMVRRAGRKLTLCGRAPIEHIEVPPEVPKAVRKYYAAALVAHQSGHTLAANFMLRVLIEQWVRAATIAPEGTRVDDLLSSYLAGLPADFKSRFPSLTDVYTRLSQDIHQATGSEDEFEHSRRDILRHFDARRVYDLDAV